MSLTGEFVNIEFLGKIYRDFENNPKARSEWAESQVKTSIERNKPDIKVISTDDIINKKVRLEKSIKVILDQFFKNKNMYSIDLILIYEKEEMKKQREKDQIFVKEIIEKRKSFDLGSFFKQRHYHIDIEYEKHGRTLKRVGINLVPLVFFVEVKSYLTGSKPPFVSETEIYKMNYALKEFGLPIIIALVEINLENKYAEIGLKLVKEFKGVNDEWIKFFPDLNKGFPMLKSSQLPPPARKDLPLKFPKNSKPHINVQFMSPKGNIEIIGELVGYDKVYLNEIQDQFKEQ